MRVASGPRAWRGPHPIRIIVDGAKDGRLRWGVLRHLLRVCGWIGWQAKVAVGQRELARLESRVSRATRVGVADGIVRELTSQWKGERFAGSEGSAGGS